MTYFEKRLKHYLDRDYHYLIKEVSHAPLSQDLEIFKIRSEKLDKSQRAHLSNLGLLEGETIQLVNETGGNIIIKVKASRLGLGKDIAKYINVRVL